MQFHNTLTRKTETFKPRKAGNVSLYTCGPTVYNYYHIGNLRNAVFNDTLRRALSLSGYEVKHVMNITDVGHLVSDADIGEDKLEKGARAEGKTVFEVAEHYTRAFKSDMNELNVQPPNGYHSHKHHDTYARATDFIPEQIEMIQILVKKGFAYQTEQAIYFDVQKLPDYGRLTGQKLADKETGARDQVVTDSAKHHPQDFAVWFFTIGRYADHSMYWPSPWGDGFPGWHLECSAIIHATLGDPIDIHTGGVDHIGTHHPNEMAQTEAAYGDSLANFWIHNEFILVNGTKMSKSKGNAYILSQIKEHGFTTMALRLLYLEAHYRTELNFSFESLTASTNTLRGLMSWAELLYQPDILPTPDNSQSTKFREAISGSLADDLDTPGALARLHEFASAYAPTQALLEFLDEAFALNLSLVRDLPVRDKQTILDRETARHSKDWSRSDQIREHLEKSGIALEDTPSGPRWKRLGL